MGGSSPIRSRTKNIKTSKGELQYQGERSLAAAAVRTLIWCSVSLTHRALLFRSRAEVTFSPH